LHPCNSVALRFVLGVLWPSVGLGEQRRSRSLCRSRHRCSPATACIGEGMITYIGTLCKTTTQIFFQIWVVLVFQLGNASKPPVGLQELPKRVGQFFPLQLHCFEEAYGRNSPCNQQVPRPERLCNIFFLAFATYPHYS